MSAVSAPLFCRPCLSFLCVFYGRDLGSVMLWNGFFFLASIVKKKKVTGQERAQFRRRSSAEEKGQIFFLSLPFSSLSPSF